MNVTIEESAIQQVAAKAEDTALTARKVHVTDIATRDEASENLRAVKGLMAEVTSVFGPMKQKAAEAHKTIVAAEKKQLEPLLLAEAYLKRELGAYEEVQRQARVDEARRLEAEARKRAEEEALLEAIHLEESGAKEEAAAVLAAPIVVAPVIRPQEPPKAAGVSYRTLYSAVVTDLGALVKAVAEGKVPLAAIQPNMSVLDAQARSLKDTLAWPGVQVRSETSVSGRR
jgi:hypothetical protein